MRSLVLFALFLRLPSAVQAQTAFDIPDTGWHLWLDRDAPWQNDSLYLPGDAQISHLPANIPTGGWDSLHGPAAITVSLPSTVEEHFWGVNGFRPFKGGEYVYESEDSAVKNGNYIGVSWWSRDVEVPKEFKGKNVTLSIRGARLRAEVFWNRQLVGYNIVNETSFTCDLTGAVVPGRPNQLAIRITNPGGRLDWVDTELLTWGRTALQKSHGFGGMDRGLRLLAHNPVSFSDLWVLNRPEQNRITACATVTNPTGKVLDATVRFDVHDPSGHGPALGSSSKTVRLQPRSSQQLSADLACSPVESWSLDAPRLYTLHATLAKAWLGAVCRPRDQRSRDGHASARDQRSRDGLTPQDGKQVLDSRDRTFGFRWFTATGIGRDAMLRLNGQRIRLLSAISWGFWGHNGLWPTRELAEREVRAAKTFGMNCLQFHRNVGKAEVFDAQDRLGLLRYMEPGGGQTALGTKFSLYASSPKGPVDVSGRAGDPSTFAERYMEEKIVRMVRDHRSHPSLMMYALQNEIHPDLNNPRIFRVLRRVHAEDPSRIVVLKSGFPENSPVNQAWMLPYDDSVYVDRGDGCSGWWDAHTVGGPGVWKDDLYRSPTDFTHRSVNDSEIVVWGEMLGSAAPDRHGAMVREIKETVGKSYDLKDHEEILAAYDRFLDRWHFRTAFPDADALFTSIGNRAYDFWDRVIETARLSEANDYFVMSGWESTAIENHSGLLDNLRRFKGDPALLGARTAPLRPVIKPRSLVVARDSAATLDLFVLNESHAPHGGSMRLWMKDASGRRTELGTWPVPPYREDQFVYAVAAGVRTPPLDVEGTVSVGADLVGQHAASWVEEFRVVAPASGGLLPRTVGVLSIHPAFAHPFALAPGLQAVPYRRGETYDLLLAANRFVTPPQSAVDSTQEIRGTADPALYRSIHYGTPENFDYMFSGLPKGPVKVTLKFAEIFRDAAGMRVFDMALNGRTVLKDFDVFKAAGGKFIAFDTAFTVSAPDAIVRLTVPRVAAGSARICGMKLETPDTVIAVKCGGAPYRDRSGLLWKDYRPSVQLDNDVLAIVRAGTPLLVLSEGEGASTSYASRLAEAGAWQYLGYVGEARASWMGSWYFVRDHPVYGGLPVDCAMNSLYQVGVENSGGIMVDGPGVDVFVGYSRDHDRNIGAGSCTASLGKGRVLFHCVPGVVSGLSDSPAGMHPVMLRRLIANSLSYLMRR